MGGKGEGSGDLVPPCPPPPTEPNMSSQGVTVGKESNQN